MSEEKKIIKIPHNIIIEDRKNVTISGVSDIDSFDEQTVILFTDLGDLTIKGFDLHINKLNVDTGELTMEGNIISLLYTDEIRNSKNGGLFSKIFK